MNLEPGTVIITSSVFKGRPTVSVQPFFRTPNDERPCSIPRPTMSLKSDFWGGLQWCGDASERYRRLCEPCIARHIYTIILQLAPNPSPTTLLIPTARPVGESYRNEEAPTMTEIVGTVSTILAKVTQDALRAVFSISKEAIL